jgi:flagellar biogenesis protein FliO
MPLGKTAFRKQMMRNGQANAVLGYVFGPMIFILELIVFFIEITSRFLNLH